MIGRNTAAGEKLTAYAQRIAHLLDEIDALREDLKEVKSEAKHDGFNVQALTKLVAIRRNQRHADKEAEMLNDLVLYAHATGTPLDLAMPEDDWPSDRAASPSGPAEEPVPSAAE
jgi:uncharacterized protein (UPF0335 family)